VPTSSLPASTPLPAGLTPWPFVRGKTAGNFHEFKLYTDVMSWQLCYLINMPYTGFTRVASRHDRPFYVRQNSHSQSCPWLVLLSPCTAASSVGGKSCKLTSREPHARGWVVTRLSSKNDCVGAEVKWFLSRRVGSNVEFTDLTVLGWIFRVGSRWH